MKKIFPHYMCNLDVLTFSACDTDVGIFGFARSVDNTTHNRDRELNIILFLFPNYHKIPRHFHFALGFFCTFARMNQETRRHIASWMLLAVFVPMLLLSSVHVHETGETIETECADCVHHNCHGHLTAMATWAHDCVLCQFLTFSMLAAVMQSYAC